MELGILDALNWVTTICDQLEKHVQSAAKDFEAFFKKVTIRIDPSDAILQTESAIEITTDALYAIQIQNLLEEGFTIQRLNPETNDEKTYAISFRDEIPLRALFIEQKPAKIARDLNAILKTWALYDIPEDILRGWYEIKMKYPFLDPRLPLISGEAFDVAFGFDNSTKIFTLKLDGQIAVSYFKQFILPEISDWTWNLIENSGNSTSAIGEAEISDEEFTELTLGTGVQNAKDLKYELELLEYQVYTLPFYNSWELGEVRYKQGLTYYRLAHVDLKNKDKYIPEALEAFNFVQGTDYKNSYNGRMLIPRLIQECSGKRRARRQQKSLILSPAASSE